MINRQLLGGGLVHEVIMRNRHKFTVSTSIDRWVGQVQLPSNLAQPRIRDSYLIFLPCKLKQLIPFAAQEAIP